MSAPLDVLVIGGGPGGAITAALLARMGHKVEVWEAERFPRFRIGESLPPRCAGLLKHLGFEKQLAANRFALMHAHTSVWGSPASNRGVFDEGYGLQVERSVFDTVLLNAADVPVHQGRRATGLIEENGRIAGATCSEGGSLREVRARHVVLAAGAKCGLGRHAGNPRVHLRQWALFGYWRCPNEPPGPEANDTIVESIPDGWVWSLRLASGLRNVTVLFGRDKAPAVKATMRSLYLNSLASTSLLRGILAAGSMAGPLRACDASWQEMDRVAIPGLLLVGDSGSVIDPLTSQGVYKSLCSALTASAALNTSLRRPEMEQVALDYFNEDEQRTYEGYAGGSVRTMRLEHRWAGRPFWKERHNLTRWDAVADMEAAGPPVAKEQFAIEAGLSNQMRLAGAPGVRVESRPSISGSFIELSECLVSSRFSYGYRGPHAGTMIEVFNAFRSGRTIQDVLHSTNGARWSAILKIIAYMRQEGLLVQA